MLISRFINEHIEDDVIAFENKYKIVLPDTYRGFLLKYNGGDTPKSHFKMNQVSSDITGFFGFQSTNEYLDFQYLIKLEVLNSYLTDQMLPMATNDFGDMITIGLAGNGKAQVYFLYHDRPKKYLWLAKDFKGFVGQCKSEKLGHIPTIEERKRWLIDNGKGDKITDVTIKGWQAEIDEYGNMKQEGLVI